MSDSLAIEASGLAKTYGRTKALDGLDLEVGAGAILGMLGPNGAGKTTTVRVLTTLLRPDRGTARVAGHDVVTEAAEVRRQIGLTGQYAALDECLTGRANLVMIGQLGRLLRREARQRASELLARFDLTDAADRGVKTYSGGMRRRLDLAASLVGRPRILFLDEPTTGLDLPSRMVTWDAVRELAAERHHGAAHHAAPGRGRPAGRPDRGRRPRQGHRRGHRGPAQGQGRRRAGAADGGSRLRPGGGPRRAGPSRRRAAAGRRGGADRRGGGAPPARGGCRTSCATSTRRASCSTTSRSAARRSMTCS